MRAIGGVKQGEKVLENVAFRFEGVQGITWTCRNLVNPDSDALCVDSDEVE